MNQNEQKSILWGLNEATEKKLDKANLRLKISTRINKFGLPGAVLLGIFVGMTLK